MNRNFYLILLYCLLFSVTCFAQNLHTIDSLLIVLKTAKEDTSKVNTLNAVCIEKRDLGEYTDAIKYVDEALTLAEKIGFKKGEAESCHLKGNVFYYLSDYTKSFNYYQKGFSLSEQLGYKVEMAVNLLGIGWIYVRLSDYLKALEYFQRALTLNEQTGNKDGIANSFHGIGAMYYDLSDIPKALENDQRALTLYEQLGNKEFIARTLNNIGMVYNRLSDYQKALEYYQKALMIFRQKDSKYGVAYVSGNIGADYISLSDYPKALENYYNAIKIAEEIGDKSCLANAYNNIGVIYKKQSNQNEALKYGRKGLSVALEIRGKDLIRDAYHDLALINAKLGNYKAAYDNEVLFKQYYDSIYNKENEKKLTALQMQYEFDKKESLAKAEQVKKDAITQKEMQKQKLLRNGLLFVFVALLIMAVIIFILVIQYREIRLIKKERTRISRELHDDIGAELTRITVISQQLQKKTNEDVGTLEKLMKISDAGKNVLGTIGEIIWTMNQQKDTLENLVAYIRRYATEYLEMNDIEVTINVPYEIPAKSVSSEYRRNIFLAVKEAISNITKYSKATQVQLSMKFRKKQAEFEISDNGTGFSLKEKANWGNGLRNMDQRMKEIGGDFLISSEKNLGTLIKLTFPVF
jgi:signal transduction histidine kinase